MWKLKKNYPREEEELEVSHMQWKGRQQNMY